MTTTETDTPTTRLLTQDEVYPNTLTSAQMMLDRARQDMAVLLSIREQGQDSAWFHAQVLAMRSALFFTVNMNHAQLNELIGYTE